MKKIHILLGVVIGLLSVTTLSYAADNGKSFDGIVAVVNDGIICQTELNKEITIIKQQLQASHAPIPADKELKHKVLAHLIDMKLQLEEADKANITVEQSKLDTALGNIAKENHLTVAQLKQAITQQGMRFDEFQQHIRDQIRIGEILQQKVASQVQISDVELKKHLAGSEGNKTREAKIKQQLYDQKYNAAIKDWLLKLRAAAYIKETGEKG
ncbi:hypothetical protein BH10PSE19_BH10PSE19_07990 [soil metagenome]